MQDREPVGSIGVLPPAPFARYRSDVKVKDESEWQKQLADFAKDDDPMSEILPTFVIAWCERGERFLDETKDMTPPPPWSTPIGSLRAGLRATEQDLGRLQIGFLGMALVIITAHWEPGGDPQEFFDSMTIIEQNLFADVAALKIADMELQAQAAQQESNGSISNLMGVVGASE